MNINKMTMELLVKENEALKAKVWTAQSILRNSLEWVRCGIGGNCSGYPKDHPDYILQLNYLSTTPEQCLNSIKADAIEDMINELHDKNAPMQIFGGQDLRNYAKKLRGNNG